MSRAFVTLDIGGMSIPCVTLESQSYNPSTVEVGSLQSGNVNCAIARTEMHTYIRTAPLGRVLGEQLQSYLEGVGGDIEDFTFSIAPGDERFRGQGMIASWNIQNVDSIEMRIVGPIPTRVPTGLLGTASATATASIHSSPQPVRFSHHYEPTRDYASEIMRQRIPAPRSARYGTVIKVTPPAPDPKLPKRKIIIEGDD